jgi:N-acetyltransferase
MLNFNTEEDFFLENEYVCLRPIKSSDIVNLGPYAINEPDTWKHSLRAPVGEIGMQEYINQTIEQRKLGKEYTFIVFDKISKNYAGSTRFYSILPEHESMTLGFTWYGKAYRGTKVNKSCKLLMLQFAFEKTNAERIEFRIDTNNENSIAAMLSIGAIREGTLRKDVNSTNGLRRNSAVFSILRNEWFEGIKQNLIEKISKIA